MKIFPKCSLLENMGSYVQYALIALGLILVLGLLYWRWRKVSTANKSLETELKVLQPYHKGPEPLPRANAPSFPPRPAMAKSEATAFVMPTFSSVLVEPSSFVPPPSIPREGSIVELLDEQPPNKTPPRLTPLASLSEDDEEEDDDIEEGPPPLIERKEAREPAASVEVEVKPEAKPDAKPEAGDDPKAAEVEVTTTTDEPVDEPVDVADSPVAVTTKGRPGRKPKVKA